VRRAALFGAVLALLPLLPQAAPQNDAPGSPFDDWLVALRAEALSRGISQATVDLALTGLKPEPVILARDRMQPEQTQSLDAYLAERLKPKVIAKARVLAAEHTALLSRVRAAYGVPGPVMVAIWAVESNFGQFTGVRPLVPALATLAFDARRPALFRSELFEALTILDRGLVPLADLKGSWAGAMGQPQFMPSSYLKYAVDFDGDGRADIWKSQPDVFASMANYLSQSGWAADEKWGREVRISRAAMARIDKTVAMRTTGCRARREMTAPQSLARWKELGVTLAGGGALPSAALQASLVRGRQRHFLVYRNYQAILDYNCSNAYAVSVGLLADRIGAQ
jgi:membrane-bound lytic murein transglycosylase B